MRTAWTVAQGEPTWRGLGQHTPTQPQWGRYFPRKKPQDSSQSPAISRRKEKSQGFLGGGHFQNWGPEQRCDFLPACHLDNRNRRKSRHLVRSDQGSVQHDVHVVHDTLVQLFVGCFLIAGVLIKYGNKTVQDSSCNCKPNSYWKGAKGIPTKRIGRNSLKVLWKWKVISAGCLQGVFREFSGCLSLSLLWVPPFDPSKPKGGNLTENTIAAVPKMAEANLRGPGAILFISSNASGIVSPNSEWGVALIWAAAEIGCPKFMPISFFRRVSRCLKCFRTLALQ